jgi:hypothetical protein
VGGFLFVNKEDDLYMLKTRNGQTLCDDRADLVGKRWDAADTATPPQWDNKTFGLGDSILVTATPTGVFICDIDGFFKEL